MKIAIRFDYGTKQGFGHLIRCKSIINQLIQIKPDIQLFIITNNISELEDIKGVSVFIINQNEEDFILSFIKAYNPDTFFIDTLINYSTSFIRMLTSLSTVIMLHNKCEGVTHCDYFILPSEHEESDVYLHYSNVMGNRFKYGVDWIVIGEHIKKLVRKEKPNNTKKILNIAITTGGSDPEGVSIKILKSINFRFDSDVKFTFLVGKSFAKLDELNKEAEHLDSNIYIKPYNPQLLVESDVVISTFGISTYELLFLRKIVISIGHADANALGSFNLSKKLRQVIDLGHINNFDSKDLIHIIQMLKSNFMSIKKDLIQIDGFGERRIAQLILGQNVE